MAGTMLIHLGRLLGFSALFFVLAMFSSALQVPETGLVLVWLPTAIAAVIEMRAPGRFTVDLVAGLIVGALLCHLLKGYPLVTAAVRVSGTLIEIIGFIWLVRVWRLHSRRLLSTLALGSIQLVFCASALVAGCVVSAPLVLLQIAPDYYTALKAWFLSNAAAALLLFPVALLTTPRALAEMLMRRVAARIAVIAASVLLVTALAAYYQVQPYLEISTALVVAALLLPLLPSVILATGTVVAYGAATYLIGKESSWLGLANDLDLFPTALIMGGPILVAMLKQEREERAEALAEALDAVKLQQGHLEDMIDTRTSELRAANERLQLASKQKDQFLANTSHEMRTPLHAIRAFAQMAVERFRDGKADKLVGYLDRIQESAQRLSHFVDSLLDLSRLIAGKVILQRRAVNLVMLIETTAGTMEAIFQKKGQSVDIQVRSSTAELLIDPDKFRQVISNLLSNASKFSPPDSRIEVTVDDAQLDEASAVCLMVGDRGVGIPETETATIFESFNQSSRTATGAGGTGLGLSISREIVRLHHGSIRALNRPGGGAVFEVILPLASTAEKQVALS